jgi:hypothetical protein
VNCTTLASERTNFALNFYEVLCGTGEPAEFIFAQINISLPLVELQVKRRYKMFRLVRHNNSFCRRAVAILESRYLWLEPGQSHVTGIPKSKFISLIHISRENLYIEPFRIRHILQIRNYRKTRKGALMRQYPASYPKVSGSCPSRPLSEKYA